jgi:phosphoenolpyruvate carboxykinase (ATP)
MQDLKRLTEGLHAHRRGEGRLASNGALVAMTGARTGRSPRDKFTVEDDQTRDRVDWGKVNQPFPPEKFEALLQRVLRHMAERDLYIMDLAAGADPTYRLPIQVICEYAWHALFVRQLFVRPERPTSPRTSPNSPSSPRPSLRPFPSATEPAPAPSSSPISPASHRPHRRHQIRRRDEEIHLRRDELPAPARDVLPMHCSANVGADGVTALFFGLSGTGKTTLSADPAAASSATTSTAGAPTGIFNFEGGCYAKCVDLSEEKEPQIFHAIRFGSVLENVVLDPPPASPTTPTFSSPRTPAPPIQSTSLRTPSSPASAAIRATSCFSPRMPSACCRPSPLTPEQAMYHFLSGYTAKLAGTEAGLGSEPVPEFSACFGSPFLPLAPTSTRRCSASRLKAAPGQPAGWSTPAGPAALWRRQAHEPQAGPRTV